MIQKALNTVYLILIFVSNFVIAMNNKLQANTCQKTLIYKDKEFKYGYAYITSIITPGCYHTLVIQPTNKCKLFFRKHISRDKIGKTELHATRNGALISAGPVHEKFYYDLLEIFNKLNDETENKG